MTCEHLQTTKLQIGLQLRHYVLTHVRDHHVIKVITMTSSDKNSMDITAFRDLHFLGPLKAYHIHKQSVDRIALHTATHSVAINASR